MTPPLVKWTFTDSVTATTYTLEVNPNEGGTPGVKRNLLYKNTAAPEGRTLMFEGRRDPQELEWSGKILREEQHNAFMEWADKMNQIILTDDLQRTFTVFIHEYTPKRSWKVNHVWHHEYTMRATVLDWS